MDERDGHVATLTPGPALLHMAGAHHRAHAAGAHTPQQPILAQALGERASTDEVAGRGKRGVRRVGPARRFADLAGESRRVCPAKFEAGAGVGAVPSAAASKAACWVL